MRWGKIVSAGMFASLAYRYSEYFRDRVAFLFQIIPIVQTLVEMYSYAPSLKLYLREHEGAFPYDLSS